jgi:hypothetical protein
MSSLLSGGMAPPRDVNQRRPSLLRSTCVFDKAAGRALRAVYPITRSRDAASGLPSRGSLAGTKRGLFAVVVRLEAGMRRRVSSRKMKISANMVVFLPWI